MGLDLLETRQIWRSARGRHGSVPYIVEEKTLRLDGDLSSVAEVCRDPKSIAAACGFAASLSEASPKRTECGVYVIGVEGLPVSKIGISHCPMNRLAELQGAHWADLVLHAVVWCPTRKAGTIEQTALRAASEMDCRLNGEWVAMEPAEAFETVLKAARFTKKPICDSATWLENWTARTRSLAHALRLPRAA